MVSDSITLGFKGPLWVWVKETQEERSANNELLQRENAEKIQRMHQCRENAKIPGTPEYQYLEALNRNIAEYNANRGPNDPRRMPHCPYWEFSEEIKGRVLGEGWIGSSTVRRSFMIIFTHSLKEFKLRLEDIVG